MCMTVFSILAIDYESSSLGARPRYDRTEQRCGFSSVT